MERMLVGRRKVSKGGGPVLGAGAMALALLPLALPNPYVLQILTNSWLYALLGLSLTLVAGTVGLVSLGHAALLAIGGRTAALLSIHLGMPVTLSILLASALTARLAPVPPLPSLRV